MMERAASWWRARTSRERLLLRATAAFVFAVLLPVWVYLAAAEMRADAAAQLEAARVVEAQVAQLAETSRAHAGAAEGNDGTVRGRALAAAQAIGLTAARVESNNADQVTIVFEPADSIAIYRWIEAVGRSGAYVNRTEIVRVNDTELVAATFDVSAAP